MIRVEIHDDEASVFIGDDCLEIDDVAGDNVIARATLDELADSFGRDLPTGLPLRVHSSDGFGTYLFHEALVTRADGIVEVHLECHQPNNYWEHRYGLATLLDAARISSPTTGSPTRRHRSRR